MLPTLVLALTTAASITAAAPPAKPQVAQAKPTLQQQFDAATKAWNAGNCDEAVKLFEALEATRRVTPGSFPAAMIAVRKGKCLVDLGREKEAEESILAGLPTIQAAGDSFSGDVYLAQMALGQVAFDRYDFAMARMRYEAALGLVEGTGRLPALMGLARATAFDGTDAPLDYAEEAIKIIDAQPKRDKKLLATFMTAHARVLLNQGQVQPAYKELGKALKLMGGLTLRKVTVNEAAMRADLAEAALLDGKRDDAHRYLAYTGAGRIPEATFAGAENMDVPVCGSETGLSPEDEAVVEFSIDKDGTVSGAQTVYTHGGPKVAAAFAKAVRQWYWDSRRLAKIPAFYLASMRVELRCTRAGADVPGVDSPLRERFVAWAAKQTSVAAGMSQDTKAADKLRQMLADPHAEENPARYVALTGELSLADERRPAKIDALLANALTTARKASLPDEVTNALEVFQILNASPWNEGLKIRPKRDLPIYAQKLFDLAATPDIAKDAIAADTLRLSGAKLAHSFKDSAPVIAQLKLVAGDSRLAAHHPLRQAANLQLANFAAQAHKLDEAQAYYERTGLTEEQCSLLGVKPAMSKSNVSSRDFPHDALMYRFEGWTQVEFDVKADGSTARGRTLIAYPPFVFSDSAAAITKNFVFEKSYGPDNSVACAADREPIDFRIPSLH